MWHIKCESYIRKAKKGLEQKRKGKNMEATLRMEVEDWLVTEITEAEIVLLSVLLSA